MCVRKDMVCVTFERVQFHVQQLHCEDANPKTFGSRTALNRQYATTTPFPTAVPLGNRMKRNQGVLIVAVDIFQYCLSNGRLLSC
jgi:hypothetical protein